MKFLALYILVFVSASFAQIDNQWIHYDKNNSGLPVNGINSITFDSNNVKWIATWMGLVRFDDHSWKVFNQSNGLISDHVTAVAVDRHNNIWIIDSLLSMYNGERWTHFTSAKYKEAPDKQTLIAIDDNNVKWIVTLSKYDIPDILISYNDSTFKIYDYWHGYDPGRIKAIATYKNEKWIGSYSGVEMYDDKK